MKVKNSLNYKPKDGFVTTKPSETIPDQTMSMRTILNRFAQGLPVAEGKDPIYDEENESMGINPKRLDLVDLQQIRLENEDKIKRLQKKMEETERKKQEEQKKVDGGDEH